MMEEGYRIPDISEFVQDFEYERRYDFTWYDISQERAMKTKDVEIWIPQKVWWLPRNKEESLKTIPLGMGGTLTYSINSLIDKPYNIESYLRQGLIRIKI